MPGLAVCFIFSENWKKAFEMRVNITLVGKDLNFDLNTQGKMERLAHTSFENQKTVNEFDKRLQ